jgi:NitT/TauT family transport system substrate-binding protein
MTSCSYQKFATSTQSPAAAEVVAGATNRACPPGRRQGSGNTKMTSLLTLPPAAKYLPSRRYRLRFLLSEGKFMAKEFATKPSPRAGKRVKTLFGTSRLPLLPAVLLCLALILAACGGDNKDPAKADQEGEADTDRELTPLNIQLDWLPTPSYAPAFLADAKGYFEEEGLDVTITPGGGQVPPVELLASGEADIVLGTLDRVPRAVSEGIPLVAVAVLERLTTASVMTPSDSGIDSPKDLEGRSIASCAADVAAVLLKPYLLAAGVDPEKVEMNNVDCAAKVSLLVAGKADAITGFSRNEQSRLEVGHDIETTVFPYVDVGLRLLSTGIFTTQQMVDEEPDVMTGAVRALLRGYADALADPEASVRAAEALYPEYYADVDVDIAHAKLFAEFVSDQVVERLGFQRDEDWANTIDLLEKYSGLENPLSPSEYYTNDFLPEEDLLND